MPAKSSAVIVDDGIDQNVGRDRISEDAFADSIIQGFKDRSRCTKLLRRDPKGDNVPSTIAVEHQRVMWRTFNFVEIAGQHPQYCAVKQRALPQARSTAEESLRGFHP